MSSDSHRSFIVVCVGWILLAVIFEALVAEAHRASLLRLHQHLSTPTTHAFALIGMALGLWPVAEPLWRPASATNRLLRALAITLCLTAAVGGFVLIAALLSVIFSTSDWLMGRSRSRRSAQQ